MTNETDCSGSNAGRRLYIIDRAFDIVRLVLFLSFAGFVVYRTGLTIQAFAGKTTDADVLIGFISGGSGITITISATLNLGLLMWGLGERRLRGRLIRQFAERPRELEHRLDPNRSSSGLTPDGRTPPNRN